ncbi:MAG: protein kinase [archaeon]|nr:protein kinase [archaeon]
MNKYQILQVIGDGTYGTVYAGKNTLTNEKVAIKKLKNKIKSWEECINMSEVRILKDLHHENIVKLHEIIREQNSDVSYIFEYADINLYEYMNNFRKKGETIPEPKIKNIIYQIVSGLKYLHEKGIMHRDLKPENILIMQDTNLIKIADFGVAREIPTYASNSMTDYVCTRWYRAPECILKSTEYNESIDVWAVGCIMCELYNLKPFFPGQDEFDQLNKVTAILGTPAYNDWPEGFKLIQKLGMKFPNAAQADLSQVVKGICPEAVKFLKEIFTWDPKNRSTCSMLLNSKYFNDFRPGTYSFPKRNAKRLAPITGGGFERNMNTAFGKNSGSDNAFNNALYKNTNSNGFTNNLLSEEGTMNNNLNSGSSTLRGFDKEFEDFNIKKLEATKNDNYLRNLNFRNYQNNGGIIPDINSLFNKEAYINGAGFAYGKGRSDYKDNSYRQRGFLNDNSKYKFSSLAENSIFSNNKKNYRGNSNNPYGGTGILPPLFNSSNRNSYPLFGQGREGREETTIDYQPNQYNSNIKYYNKPAFGRMNNLAQRLYL